jgi:glucoside 3-dehydrogenase (cytochrome c) hitch-hiker subunit
MKKQKPTGMGRRQALERLMAGAGAASALPRLGQAKPSGPKAEMRGMPMPDQISLGAAEPPDPSLASPDWKPKFFDEHENETVVALSDLIIPDTDTPGAKAAQVNRFIDLYLAAETPETQKQYLQALAWLDGYCLSKYTKPFTGLGRSEQDEVLTLFTRRPAKNEPAPGAQKMGILKGSIVEAYYSSEIGAVQELKYQTNPFQPEFPGCKNPEEH